MKKFKRLWVYGSSNSVPGLCVEPEHSFWGLCARHLGCDSVTNLSWHGNSLDGVMHTLISCQDQYDWDQDFFLVGIPPLERWAVFDQHRDSITIGHNLHTQDWHTEPFEVQCRHGIVDVSFHEDRNTVVFEDRAWTEIQALRSIYLLNAWLQQQSRNYVIVNLSKAFDANNAWAPSEFLLPTMKTLNNNILFRDTYHSVNIDVHRPVDFDTYGWNGHHGAAGNKHFFEKSLLPTLHECGLC